MREVVLEGPVIRGLRIASGLNRDLNQKLNYTIRRQKPFFIEAGVPEFGHIWEGTINLSIAPKKFQILRPDHEVTCEWFPGVTETFWLVQARLVHNGRERLAYIYYPCPSPVKSHDDTVVEVLTEWVPNLQYGDQVSVHGRGDRITLRDGTSQ